MRRVKRGSKLLKDTKYFSEVDLKKNINIDFDRLASGSGIKIWWICSNGHSYDQTPNKKSHGRKCPYCTPGSKKVSIEKSILKKKSELAKLWHPTKNGKLKPSEVNAGSRKTCWFLCKKGHEFKISPKEKGYYFTCPYCSGHKITWDNNLEYLYPDIVSQWHPTKNKKKPNLVSPGSHHKAWWICKKNHILKIPIRYKVKNPSACPKCYSQISKVQLKVYSELKFIFKDIKIKEIINKTEIDIYIPTKKLALEYDGSFFHKKNLDRDKKKNKYLKTLSIDLIRIREKPLKKISKNDILVSQNALYKKDINSLILRILKIKKINPKIKSKIKIYLKAKKFLMEKEYLKLLNNYPNPMLENSLEYKFPNLIEEWDFKKNKNISPNLFSYGSKEKVWWICKKAGHSWKTTISDRTGKKKVGCRICNQINMKERFLAINKSRIGKKRAW